MKLKLKDIQNILNANIYDKAFPIKTSYALSRLAKVLTSELATFDAQRQKLIEKYEGALNEDKTLYTFTQENSEAFAREISELTEMEIEVPFEPLTLDSFGSVNLTPNDLVLIGSLIQE